MGRVRFMVIAPFFITTMVLCAAPFNEKLKSNTEHGSASIKNGDAKASEKSAVANHGKAEGNKVLNCHEDMTSRIRVTDDGSVQHVNYQKGIVCAPDGSKTILELLGARCASMGSDPFLGTIVGSEVKYRSAEDIWREAEGLAALFARLLAQEDKVGIYSVNRYEWVVSEMASYMSGCINVPLYSTFSPADVRQILAETEMKVCVASADKAQLLLETVLEDSKAGLSCIVLMDRDAGVAERLRNAGVLVYYFGDVVSSGDKAGRKRYPKGDDLATICYTSGTSGSPKGVMLTHRNFVSCVAGISRGSRAGEMVEIGRDDVYLSYLPLAHVMERVCMNISMASGCRIVFFRGNLKEIKEDYLVVRPTFIIAVPRVLNLFKEKIEEKVQQKNFAARCAFRGALWYKMWRVSKGELRSRFVDWLVFDRIAKEFGGRINRILCGSAPLRREVLVYMQAVLSCRIFQGYGQTENVGAGIVQPLDSRVYDNVGIPFPANEVNLGEIPEELGSEYMRRYPGCRVGEILLRGDNVTQGYYKRPKETGQLFTKDGWLRTGDIGMFDSSAGVFSVIGRVKDGFKTSQGEYIDPEKLEVLYADGDVVQDVCIPRRSDSDRIVAIVVCPETKKSDAEILAHVRETGEKLFKQRRITRLEIPWRVVVLRRGFESFEGADLLTPTAKKRRPLIERYFSQEIDSLLGIK
ncbi:LONG CHAIN FATTY ACID CoA LIGASE [Encephalitozoon cuniculi GB-M1]|uniref:LONG CHAIN FATTY ACID CoA LIGASE n=1 Tax=Encephalitozoon cuniculi (strain GB-M1) TaxID=284813 RepID=Q8SR38_ENCCU|nr:long-chain fatty acid--CoA ligase [Encephalitozoon cuniculi GB-M1]CAD25810.2 LONG CHAIN FATTY ACID CoA LIGASE [Encephalitozoon cuniculi GB-M1]